MRAAAISSGRYDVAPCLAQDVVAVSEEGAQLDGFAGLALLESDREAPGAGRVVAVDVRGRDLGVRRGRHDGLDGRVGRQLVERGPVEIDDDLLLVLGQGREAAAAARLQRPGAGRMLLAVALPAHAVG